MTAYLAPLDLEQPLEQELKGITARYDRLFLTNLPLQNTYWAQNIWLNPQVITFRSISDAVQKLKSLNKLWTFYPHQLIRRGNLISEQLAYFHPKPIPFPSPLPTVPLGAWLLLDANTLLASPKTSSPFPHGEVLFRESKLPPSRAYLKLWEFFTRIQNFPKKGERCLELGASPGGWTFVLQAAGAHVTAIDRSELAPEISSLPNVSFVAKDAFSIAADPSIDWVFSDVACFPKQLLVWVKRQIEAGIKAHFVCTLKFQGPDNYQIIKAFQEIKGSRILRLYHNKHELTWYLPRVKA